MVVGGVEQWIVLTERTKTLRGMSQKTGRSKKKELDRLSIPLPFVELRIGETRKHTTPMRGPSYTTGSPDGTAPCRIPGRCRLQKSSQ